MRQEVEGRAIKKTRRGLLPRSPGPPTRTAHDPTDAIRDAVDELKRTGYTPEKVTAQLVPILREYPQFHAVDLDRQAATRSLDAVCDDESALAASLFVTWLYTAQIDLIQQLLEVRYPPDEGYLRFLAWTEAWLNSATIEMEDRRAQQDALIERVDASTVDAVKRRVQQRVNAVLEQTAPQTSR
jgi:hypothetical protein